MEDSPNCIRSDKLIIYSGFENENQNKLQSRQCEPPGRVLEAQRHQLKGWLIQPQPQLQPNSSSSAQAAFIGDSRTQNLIPDRALELKN